MKRTPLKRGKPIRRKRKLPRWNQNQGAREAYLEGCLKGCQLKGIFSPPGGHSDGLDPHHLLRIKVDMPEAMLGVCRNCHNWIHEHDREAAPITLLAKSRLKGGLAVDLLSKLKGRRIEWYLQPLEWMRAEALAAIEELRKGGIFW